MRQTQRVREDGPPLTASRLERSIVSFYVYKGFFGLTMGLWAPIMVLYFRAKPFSLTQFMVLMTVMNVFLVVSALPSGLVADRFNRKVSVVVGSLLMTVSLAFMIATASFGAQFASFALWGIGQSLALNADAALLYDTVKALGRESGFQRIAGNVASIGLIATVAGTLASGFLVRYGMQGSMVAGLCCLALSTAASIALVEPPFLKEGRREANHLHHLRESLKVVAGNRQVLALALSQIVVLRLYNLANRPFAQPALLARGYSASLISFAFAGFFILSAVFAKSSHLVDRLAGKREHRSVALPLVVAASSLGLFAYGERGALLLLSLAGLYAANGLAGPVLATSLNRRIDSAQRATCLAIVGMGESALGIVLGPVYGRLADAYSLQLGMRALLWCFGPLLAVSVFLVLLTIRPRARAAVAPGDAAR